MKRKITLLLTIIVIFSIFVPVASHAAYSSTMPVTAQGNSDNIIYIKRPESLSASTSDRTYTISAVGVAGTAIKIYKYDKYSDICKLIKGTTYIGASGFFSTVVNLNEDSNTFMVYAENANGNQIVRIDINKIKQSTVNKLKNVTVTMSNFFLG